MGKPYRTNIETKNNNKIMSFLAGSVIFSTIVLSGNGLKRLILFPSSNAFARIQARLSFSLAAKLSISAKSYDSLPVR